jgi:hypothetical protein
MEYPQRYDLAIVNFKKNVATGKNVQSHDGRLL